jgi:hypothetical protein
MIIKFKKKGLTLPSTFLLDNIKIISVIYLFLIVGSYVCIDKTLALYFQTLSPLVQAPFLFIGKVCCPIAWILILPAIFFYIRFVMRREKKSRKVWYMSLALPLVILACKLLELILGKATPEWFFLHQETPFRFFEWNKSFHSFPSITSATIAGIFVSLSCVFAKQRFFLLIGGALLVFAPVITSTCFLSDALAGFYVGGIISQWVFQKVRREVSL